jgi:hypothetical protein
MKLVPAAATNGKVLIPLATMLAAGAVAIGSGASFTSTSVHTATVTSGILHHTNDHNGVTLAISNLQPGDSQTGTLTIKNDGTLDATAALTASAVNSSFSSALNLRIDEVKADGTTATLYNSDFAGAGTVSNSNLGALPIGKSLTVTYTVSLNSAAVDADQNKSAGARFAYVTTQGAGNSTKSFDAITPSPAPTAVTPTVAP